MKNECWRRHAKKGEFSSENARMRGRWLCNKMNVEIVRRGSREKRGKIVKIGLAEVRDITECTRKKIEDEVL